MNNLNLASRYNEKGFSSIVQNSPIGICITDENGNFEFMNKEYCTFYGYSSEELIGEHFTMLVPEENKKFMSTLHDKYIEGKKEVEGEWEVIDKKGNKKTILANATRILGKDQKPKKVTYIIDITRLKQMQNKLKTQYYHLEQANQKIEKDIKKARILHKQFFPARLPEIKHINLGAKYSPAEEIGGDFYNFIKYKNNFIFYLVDIPGHSLDGAMLNIFVRETINSFLLSESNEMRTNPKSIINFIYNSFIKENFPEDYFICILIGIINLDNMKFRFVNSGIQVNPIVINNSGDIHELKSSWLPISKTIDEELFYLNNINQQTIYLKDNSNLFFSTDGLIEGTNDKGKIYGTDKIKTILKDNLNCKPNDIIEKIYKDFKQFTNKKLNQDDITILMINKE